MQEVEREFYKRILQEKDLFASKSWSMANHPTFTYIMNYISALN